MLAEKYNLKLTPSRMDIVSSFYIRYVMDIGHAIEKVKSFYDEIKKIELSFFKDHDINIVLEEDAIDFIIEQMINSSNSIDSFYNRLSGDIKLGLKLVLEKTGKNRFFITREALTEPEIFLDNLIKAELSMPSMD